MQFHPNELFLVCNPQSTLGKQTKALARDICNHINEVDVLTDKLSPTYWKEIINLLKLQPQDLLDKSHPDYRKKIGDNTYTMDGWLEVLVKNGYMVKAPIAIYRGMAVLCETPTDIFKLRPAREQKAMPHLKSYKERD